MRGATVRIGKVNTLPRTRSLASKLTISHSPKRMVVFGKIDSSNFRNSNGFLENLKIQGAN